MTFSYKYLIFLYMYIYNIGFWCHRRHEIGQGKYLIGDFLTLLTDM